MVNSYPVNLMESNPLNSGFFYLETASAAKRKLAADQRLNQKRVWLQQNIRKASFSGA